MNQLIPIISLIFLCFLSCKSANDQQKGNDSVSEKNDITEEDFLLVPGTRIGWIIVNKSTREDVLSVYGKEAKLENIELGEGFTAEGIVLYPDDPAKRVEIYWDMELDSLRPGFIRIIGDGAGHSRWHTSEGITIGTPLKEVEKLNGKPFLIYGFNWDFGGIVNSWDNGNLQETLGLTFAPTTLAIPEYLQGDRLFQSNDKNILEVEPVVSVIESSFRE